MSLILESSILVLGQIARRAPAHNRIARLCPASTRFPSLAASTSHLPPFPSQSRNIHRDRPNSPTKAENSSEGRTLFPTPATPKPKYSIRDFRPDFYTQSEERKRREEDFPTKAAIIQDFKRAIRGDLKFFAILLLVGLIYVYWDLSTTLDLSDSAKARSKNSGTKSDLSAPTRPDQPTLSMATTPGTESVPGSGAATPTSTIDPNAPIEKQPDDASKLKTFVGLLRKFIGVSDLAAIRFSLPAHLMEPIPNLEYWNYMDRPETFISIPDSEEPLGRMLGALRFWLSKDLKYVKGKPIKPYNSTLGEFFRCNWEIEDSAPPLTIPGSAPQSSAASISSQKSATAPPTSSTLPATAGANKVKISFLTEQTSHHPPVSAYYIDCPEKGIIARGYDQISAKFTGTSIKVTAGDHNAGIYIELQKRDNEVYQLTHPAAHLGGILRGKLSISVADHCYITCPKTKLKVILQYMEEGWIGKAQNKVEGVVYKYDPEKDDKTRIKDVPEKDIIGRVEGVWTDKVAFSLGNGSFKDAKIKIPLVDLQPLFPIAKDIPPIEQQLPNESRKFWQGVTNAIQNQQYSLATTLKTEIEDRQRKKAAERKEKGAEWQPRFFTGATTPVGQPELTTDGEEVLKGLHAGDFKLSENKELGA